ncbi:MAG: hypothetical protein O7E52_16990 [Candidatus Poribacteria bacterium]|nr:hypothetical protein [Candidatus Poribacteria bacterium]
MRSDFSLRVPADISHFLYHTFRTDPTRALIALMILAHLLPIWLIHYYPTQDGPSHIANAVILKEYAQHEIFQEYFRLNLKPVPNWFSHATRLYDYLTQVASIATYDAQYIVPRILVWLLIALLIYGLADRLNLFGWDAKRGRFQFRFQNCACGDATVYECQILSNAQPGFGGVHIRHAPH